MTGTSGPDPDDPDDLRAAEYVLGTLDAQAREAMAGEAARNPVARARIAAWARRLGPLADMVPAEAPPPHVRAALLRALPAPGHAASGQADSRQIDRLRAQVRRWRIAAGGAGLLAAGLALFLLTGPSRTRSEGRYLAVVQGGGTLPALIVRVDLRTGLAQVRPVSAEAPADRSLEVWYVGAQGPRPLGLVGARQSQLRLPAGTTPDGVIAVSVEPPGGSPTGQPTGPVVYSGTLLAE